MRARDFSITATTTNQTTVSSNHQTVKLKYKHLEFKYLYFRVQSLINKRVTQSLKYEQFKSPEIHANLVKPISEKIIKLSSNQAISKKLHRVIPSMPVNLPVNQTPRFGTYSTANNINSNNSLVKADSDVSASLIFILFLLKYEFLIQSENNLILFDLLSTKANMCELLAIRFLRVYSTFGRINMLFQAPLYNENFVLEQRFSFTTLELCVLSKSKRFLSQPIIIRIMDRFYNGELILKLNRNDTNSENYFMDTKRQSSSEAEELIGNEDYSGDQSHDIINYHFNKITMNKIIQRSNVVPKYQALVLNLKVYCFMFLYFTLILCPNEGSNTRFLTLVEVSFWLVGFNFNLEFWMRIFNVEFVFFKKIIWNYMDFVLISLVNISFVLRFAQPQYFRDAFSLISIILLPRSLSVFNNYQFFNLITLSLKKMLWNLMGLCCLFFALISGFYFSFITLSKKTNNNSEIMFDMVKVFFGFTPSVWNNWDNYNTLGKIIQMGYLFLIQFIIGSILAIVLSGVFAKISQNNHEEFNYIKTINMIVFFKSSSNFIHCQPSNNNKMYSSLYSINYKVSWFLGRVLNIFKVPIIVAIFVYEKMFSSFYKQQVAMGHELKFFTFFHKDKDYDQDQELVVLDQQRQNKLKVPANSANRAFQNDLIVPSQDFGMLDIGFESEYAVCDDDDDYDDEDENNEMFELDDENDDVSLLLMRKESAQKQGRRYSHLDASIRRVTSKMVSAKKSVSTLRASKRYTNSSDSLYGDDKRLPNSLSYQAHSLANYGKGKPASKKKSKPSDEMSEMPFLIEETRQHSGSTMVSQLNKDKAPMEEEDEILSRIKRLEMLFVHKFAASSDELIRSECEHEDEKSIIYKSRSGTDDDVDTTIPMVRYTDEEMSINSEDSTDEEA